jgi:hypothetical protein
LTISSGSIYTASNGLTTTLLGSIVNKGTILLNGGNGLTGTLSIGNSVALTGNGTVTLSTTFASGGNAILSGNNQTLTNTDNTIQGTGVIGNGSLTLINNATVDATPESTTTGLTLNGSGGVTNTNLLDATSGGTLAIAANVTNAGGNITANGSGSVVVVTNGVTIAGGTLNTANGGVMETGTASSAILQGVTISVNSTYTASDNATTTLDGAIDNAGMIQLNGGNGSSGTLSIGSGGVTLSGGGTVTMSTTAASGGAAILSGNGQTLTNTNNTIQGTGIIGNGSLTLINNATINATPESTTTGLTLNGSGGITNTGTLEATGGGTLAINTTVNSATGNVTVADGSSTVQIVNATVQGGTLNNTAGGLLETAGSFATLDGTTQGALTISSGSIYTASNGLTTTLLGSIVNKGTILLNGGNGSNGTLSIGNGVTLSGGGAVTLSTNPASGDAAIISGNGQTLINTNNTIKGTGIIGNGSLTLVNGATVDATPQGGSSGLTLNGSPITNANGGIGGVLEASGGGTLAINTTVNNATGNVTVADSSSTVQVVNATVQGGTLNNTAGGLLETAGSGATLDGTTQGALTISTGSIYTASNGTTTTLLGSIVNKGRIQLNGGNGSSGTLSIGNSVTLSGGGTVALSTTAASGGVAILSGNGQTLTNVNNTIEGTGVIGNGSLAVINDGTIDATPESTTTTLTLNGSGGVTNAGTLEATGGGTLSIAAGILTNLSGGTLTGGTYEALAGSAISIAGNPAIITDAANIILSGVGSAFDNLDNTLTTITAAGRLELDLGRVFTDPNALDNSGHIVLGGGTLSPTGLTIETGALLYGFGTVTSPITNKATVESHGGNLDLTNTVTGPGGLLIDDASSLELALPTAETVTFADPGTLLLDNPRSFAANDSPITGLGLGDAIDLTGISAVSATINGQQVTVDVQGGNDFVFNSVTGAGGADLTGVAFETVNDPSINGTDLILVQAANKAVAQINTPLGPGNTLTLADAHVAGVANDQENLSITNAATPPADGLNASIGPTTGNAYGSSTLMDLAAGSTDTTHVDVGLNDTTAGAKSGTVELDFQSDGSQSGSVSSLPSIDLSLSGNVYRLAADTITAPTNVYVHTGAGGGSLSELLTVQNTDPNDGFSEALKATATGVTGTLTGASGTTTPSVAAGGSDSSDLSVTYSTAAAGVASGNVNVALWSEGAGIDSLGETSLGTTAVPVTVNVNNYAQAAFAQYGGAGTLSGNAQTGYTLNFGTVALNSAAPTADLEALNAALGPSDLLDGTVVLDPGSQNSDFTTAGTGAFQNLGAQQADLAPTVTLHTGAAGTFTETIQLDNLVGHNPDFSGALTNLMLTVTGIVEPAPPVANNDTYSTNVGTNLSETTHATGVQGNDTDAANDPFTSVLDSGPSDAASFQFNADGTFSYTPKAGFVGTDTFTYDDVDSIYPSLVSNVATVSIVVNDTPPAANGHSYGAIPFDTPTAPLVGGSIVPNSSVTGNVLTDTSDSDANHNVTAASLASGPSHGNLSLSANGNFTYTPYLGFVGSDSFTYNSFDSYGTESSSPGTISLTVNDAPNTYDITTLASPGQSWVVNLSASQQYAVGAVSGEKLLSGINNVVAGSGSTTIIGNNNADVLIGGAGNDTIEAGSGNDILAGGNGVNTLVGGSGNDTFVFTPGSFNDTVASFNVTRDMLDFQGFNLSMSQILAADTSSGVSAVINLGPGEKITLAGVTEASLAAAQSGAGHHPFELNV